MLREWLTISFILDDEVVTIKAYKGSVGVGIAPTPRLKMRADENKDEAMVR
jgi:hypothetical protein